MRITDLGPGRRWCRVCYRAQGETWMARMLPFKEGDVLIAEGDQDTAAYLIHQGWLQVSRAPFR